MSIFFCFFPRKVIHGMWVIKISLKSFELTFFRVPPRWINSTTTNHLLHTLRTHHHNNNNQQDFQDTASPQQHHTPLKGSTEGVNLHLEVQPILLRVDFLRDNRVLRLHQVCSIKSPLKVKVPCRVVWRLAVVVWRGTVPVRWSPICCAAFVDFLETIN